MILCVLTAFTVSLAPRQISLHAALSGRGWDSSWCRAAAGLLSVPRVADALIDYMLALPGNEDVESINPLVGETNDGYLNDIRGRHITREDVFAAIRNETR